MQTSILRRALVSTVLLAGATAVATATSTPTAGAAAPADTAVSVDVRAGLATVADTALGLNHAIWDAELGSTATSDLLRAAGVRMLRYPGGSYADIYHWRDHTAPGGYVAPNTDFDTFMAAARRVGAQPMIIANYGTGTAQEAADWVRYANITRDYDVTYWTIGNENYGNGHYGAAWEADDHADKSPNEYAATVVAYAEAMKAVDPDIRIGAVLTMPANWPDALIGPGDQASWNQTVLTRAGGVIDFVDVHWYPGGSTAAESLAKTGHIEDAMFLLRQQIDRYAGPDAGRIGISMTETNVDIGRNTQPGALFLADVYSGLLERGVFTVHWWNVHNGIGTVSTVAGQTDYGDFGLLSSGTCAGDVCEPAFNTPFAPYHALTLMSSFVRPGDQFVRADTDNPLVSAHAARRPNGDLAVLLVNKDPADEHTVALAYQGWAPGAAVPVVSSYLNGAAAITTAPAGTATSQTLPAYSLTMLTVRPVRAETGPPAPARPTATVTDRTATISWPAVGSGLKYEVYRHGGGQLGETTGTSFTVRNLDPGRRYTVSVVARDGAGRTSWASPPLTFTTTTPASARCAVRFTDVTNWGNGYVGSIDVVNNGSTPVPAGWVLRFTWPTPWQRLDSGWNATWSQTDTTVTVVGDGAIAPGATVNVGFVAAYSGPNVPVGVYTLNGTLCS